MAKPPQESRQKPAPRPTADADGAKFFAKEDGGYRRSMDSGMGAGSAPPPAAKSSHMGPPPQRRPPAQKTKPQQKPKASQPKAPKSKAPAKPMDMSTPKDVSKALAETVVGAFVDRLKNEANAKGGRLTVHDIETMQVEFDRQTMALRGMFEKSFEIYVKANERAVWDQQRNYPFDRLMVKKFSHLFKEGDQLGKDDISRRMLPGFFVALGMMLGPDVVEEFQEKCRRIVERVRAGGKGVFNWDDVYNDNEGKAVSIDAEIAIAGHFQDYKKRADWFINLVNGHMAAPDASAHPNVINWTLTDAGFKKFAQVLLGDLRKQFSTDAGKLQITKRHGAETCANLFDILEQLK
ncbi:MAG: hypothetical protein A3B62_04445 [Rhodospirillales bacterium RIFCSPLOWO2_01_FULL_65_14]|nr:MAG: hypothetical protein A3B62_04445 [Rhodospirillales bacterium RIFCSPLOWO2_01_FULL_65_14]